MTEDVNNDIDIQEDELETLKERATQLGIKFHPSIGLDKLREKVNGALGPEGVTAEDEPEEEDDDEDDDSTPPAAAALTPAPRKETKREYLARKKKEAAELVRVRVTCMDPKRKEWEGDFFTVSNAVVGSYKKYVPFDVEWHVPRIIYNQIKSAKAQIFRTKKRANGIEIKEGVQIRAFAVEELPSLTKDELKRLAQRQAMSAGTAAL